MHLALTKNVRQAQLRYLEKLIPKDQHVIVAGDFNTMQGNGELDRFMRKCGLKNVNNDNESTYPSWDAQKELDYILCSEI